MKLNLVNVLLQIKFAIILLLLSLTIVFANCAREGFQISGDSADLIPEVPVNNIDGEITRGNSNPTYWKKYIQRMATAQDFDNFEIINTSGEVLLQWCAAELEIDYSSSKVLILKAKNLRTAIPWEDIIAITRLTRETITEQAIAKGE